MTCVVTLPRIMPHLASGLALLAVPLLGGGLQGQVRIHEKNGRLRDSLKDCVAILEPLDVALPPAAPSRPLTIRTVGKRFIPRVAIATPGTVVAFPNLDHIIHNVFSVTAGNRFDTGQYQPGDAPRVTVANPGLVNLYCNIHHQMNAFLWVVTTPFAQTLEEKGGVRFDQVPPGTYRLRLWHPETGERSWTVRVDAGTTQGTWDLDIALPAVPPHKNKFGRDYAPPVDERIY
jgi:hypothetical protein